MGMGLIDNAKEVHRKNGKNFTDEEIDLALAFLKGDVKSPGVSVALGFKSRSYAMYWLTTAIREAYRQGRISIKL